MMGKRDAALLRAILAATGIAAAVLIAPDAMRAQGVPGGLSVDYSKNANKPIDITAEMLEVDDKKKIATFRGAVSATQGDFNMKARELVVHYTASGGQKKVAAVGQPAAAASPLPGAGNGEITRIEATGDVILTTKDSQEAHGDTATYKVKEQIVIIQGNVRVAKGADNVIKGDKMEVDLARGTTKVDNTSGENPGRISVILTPQTKEKDKNKKPEAEKPE